MDDMGYGDLGRTGANQYETPNLNRLANQGTQFTWYYSPQAEAAPPEQGCLQVAILTALAFTEH